MKASEFDCSNFVWKGDGQRVIDLPVFKTPHGSYSCWKLSPEDLEKVMQTGVIWVGVQAQVQPPILVTADVPVEVTIERHLQKLSPDLRMRVDMEV